MKASTTFLLLLATGTQYLGQFAARAECHIYFYQVGNESNGDYFNVYAFDHDDNICNVADETTLQAGSWKSVEANKDNEDAIQIYIETTGEKNQCGYDACDGTVLSCDGSLISTSKCGIAKGSCWEHYIIYAEEDNLICKAATDDDGNVLTEDSTGDPYCADTDESDCTEIQFSD